MQHKEGVYAAEPVEAHSDGELSSANQCEMGEYDPKGRGGADSTADVVCGWSLSGVIPLKVGGMAEIFPYSQA
eukprot:COSAG06_NODE_21571_length_752_cov_2.753446_2_plen_73_part_00